MSPPKSAKKLPKEAEPKAPASKPIRRGVKQQATKGQSKRTGPNIDPNVFTELEWRFVEEYMVDQNKTRAYIRAGGTATGPAARSSGYAIYERLHVYDEIQKRIAVRSEENKATADAVIRRLALIAFGDISELAEWSNDGVFLTSSHVLNKKQTALVAEVCEEFSKTGARTVKLKTHNQLKALELLGRHFGLFAEREQDVNHEDVARKIQQALRQMDEKTNGGDQ